MRILVKAIIRIILIAIFLNLLFTSIRWVEDLWIIVPRTGTPIPWFEILVIIVVTIICMVLLYFIWWKADWFVKVLVDKRSDHELVISTSNLDLMKVALRILGIYVLVNSIPNLIGLIGYHFSFPRDYLDLAIETHANEIRNVIFIIIQILFGALLTLGTNGILKLINRVDEKANMRNNQEEKEG